MMQAIGYTVQPKEECDALIAAGGAIVKKHTRLYQGIEQARKAANLEEEVWRISFGVYPLDLGDHPSYFGVKNSKISVITCGEETGNWYLGEDTEIIKSACGRPSSLEKKV